MPPPAHACILLRERAHVDIPYRHRSFFSAEKGEAHELCPISKVIGHTGYARYPVGGFLAPIESITSRGITRVCTCAALDVL